MTPEIENKIEVFIDTLIEILTRIEYEAKDDV